MMSDISIKVTKAFLPILALVLVFVGLLDYLLERDIIISITSICKVVLIYMISLTVSTCHLAIGLNGDTTADERISIVTNAFSKFFLLIGLLLGVVVFLFKYRSGSMIFDIKTWICIIAFTVIVIWIFISHVNLTNRIEKKVSSP